MPEWAQLYLLAEQTPNWVRDYQCTVHSVRLHQATDVSSLRSIKLIYCARLMAWETVVRNHFTRKFLQRRGASLSLEKPERDQTTSGDQAAYLPSLRFLQFRCILRTYNGQLRAIHLRKRTALFPEKDAFILAVSQSNDNTPCGPLWSQHQTS